MKQPDSDLLELPVTSLDGSVTDVQLVKTPQRLELHQASGGGVLYIDFVSGKSAHRRQFGGGRGQPLARAVGLKKGLNPTVLDATAGLGLDAFVLATLGCKVQLVERSPAIAALLQDGLDRALEDAAARQIAARMELFSADAIIFMRGLKEAYRPEVVYLDPMYPHRKKSALVKKEMRVFRSLVGDDPDAAELLRTARECAIARVVVKRPAKADFLGEAEPTMSIKSPNTRYDVYIKRRLQTVD
ncbi:MAG: 16S rRNA methyltransferase [endosymbiont of Seepiophila jonesi]|uniref:Ribosomal RNA small subunit methyltransferase J n=1 Tax=endosymbiont of Lamellibrachia luymesi TaxID=2200907 RepID=A0A370E3E4_9GAMM|nr:MAG: 16S rRNA methyltransferase [endosymbiont of Seepiophila jonesi]RDH93087.1 MAG: 16S rRNA methyltransferase [endosymbiont of Lamellibrachia luymesi]